MLARRTSRARVSAAPACAPSARARASAGGGPSSQHSLDSRFLLTKQCGGSVLAKETHRYEPEFNALRQRTDRADAPRRRLTGLNLARPLVSATSVSCVAKEQWLSNSDHAKPEPPRRVPRPHRDISPVTTFHAYRGPAPRSIPKVPFPHTHYRERARLFTGCAPGDVLMSPQASLAHKALSKGAEKVRDEQGLRYPLLPR